MLVCWNQAQIFWRANEGRDCETWLLLPRLSHLTLQREHIFLIPTQAEKMWKMLPISAPPVVTKKGEMILTPGEDGRSTGVPALIGAVEGERTARTRQLPASECVTPQETNLHLCQGRVSLLFLLSSNTLCLVCSNCQWYSGEICTWKGWGPSV